MQRDHERGLVTRMYHARCVGLLIFIADLESLPIKNKIDDFSIKSIPIF